MWFGTDRENLLNNQSFLGWQSFPSFSSFILLNLEKLDPGHFKGYAKNFCQKNLMKKKKK